MRDFVEVRQSTKGWWQSANALFCCASLILCVDQLLGPYSLLRYHDWFDVIVFGERNLAREMLQHGVLGWMPGLGGMPSFVAQKAPYDIINMLMAVLPPWLVKSLMNFLVYWAAGAGMERLLREYFGLAPRVAVLGGFLFLASSIGVNVQLFVHYLPLFVLCFMDLYRGIGLRRRVGAFLLLLLMMVYSFPVISLVPYSILHFLFLLLFPPRQLSLRGKVALLGATVLLWTLYAIFYLPVFWGLWDYLPEINRVFKTPATAWSLKSLKTLVDILRSIASYTPTMTLAICCAPEMLRDRRARLSGLLLLFFLGVTAFSMMPEVITLIHGSFIEKIDLYHFLTPLPFVFVLFCVLALESMHRDGRLPSPLWVVIGFALTLPWLSTDHWVRNLLFLLVGLAVLWPNAARLPDFLRRRPGLLRGATAVAVPGVIMVFSSIMFVDVGHLLYARAFESVPELQALARNEREPFRVGGLDLAAPVAQSNGLDTVAGRKVLFNKHYKQYVLAATAPQHENAPEWMRASLDSPTELYLRFPQDTETTRRDVILNQGLPLSVDMLHLPMLQAMNTKYILSPKPVAGLEAASSDVRFVRGGGVPAWLPAWLEGTVVTRGLELPIWIYRLRETFERAYVAGASMVLDSQEDVARALQGQSVESLRRTVYFVRDELPAGAALPTPGGASGATGAVTRITPGPDVLTCEGETSAPAVIVVSNNWDKNWHARLNGAEAPLLRCNLAFQAVVVPGPGPFRLELEYHNPLLWWTHVATGLALLGLVALAFLFRCPEIEFAAGSVRGSAVASQPLPRGPVLWGGLGMSALWSVLFLFARCLKEPAASPRPVFYTLVYTTVVGVLFTFWWLRAEAFGQEPETRK